MQPAFKGEVAKREAEKAEELAPYIAAALARKPRMAELADAEIPVIRASVEKVRINEGEAG